MLSLALVLVASGGLPLSAKPATVAVSPRFRSLFTMCLLVKPLAYAALCLLQAAVRSKFIAWSETGWESRTELEGRWSKTDWESCAELAHKKENIATEVSTNCFGPALQL